MIFMNCDFLHQGIAVCATIVYQDEMDFNALSKESAHELRLRPLLSSFNRPSHVGG